jgi:hypothetical protein
VAGVRAGATLLDGQVHRVFDLLDLGWCELVGRYEPQPPWGGSVAVGGSTDRPRASARLRAATFARPCSVRRPCGLPWH